MRSRKQITLCRDRSVGLQEPLEDLSEESNSGWGLHTACRFRLRMDKGIESEIRIPEPRMKMPDLPLQNLQICLRCAILRVKNLAEPYSVQSYSKI